MNRSPLSVVAVSNDALRPEFLDKLLVDDNNYGVIVVESILRAYSRIREVHPDVVELCMEIDDSDACQLLSMLHMDRALRGMRVVARTASPGRAATDNMPLLEEPSETVLLAAC
jgi:CheY-like chemotaxis protein